MNWISFRPLSHLFFSLFRANSPKVTSRRGRGILASLPAVLVAEQGVGRKRAGYSSPVDTSPRSIRNHPASGVVTLLAFALVIGLKANAQVTIMPIGDSVTEGIDYLTDSIGGYRDPLYRHLAGEGLSFSFVGVSSTIPTPVLTAAGDNYHNGFGGWHIQDFINNIDGVAAPIGGGDNNLGGYLLTGGHGTGRSAMSPNIILLHVGTNDFLTDSQTMNQDLYTLVTHIHALCPNTIILVASVIPIDSPSFAAPIAAYNSYIQFQLVPSLYYTRYVDQHTGFLNSDGSINGALLGADLVHPTRFGYPIMAQNWAAAIESLEGVNTSSNTPLTVLNGTGSGNYPPGSIVTISGIAPPSGIQFAGWTPASQAESNPYSSLTTYTVPPGATTLTATYTASGSPFIPNGTYNAVNDFSGLSAAASGLSDGAAVLQQTGDTGSSQLWDLKNLGGNTVTLMQTGTNEALEVPLSGSSTPGASLDTSTYVGGANQQWRVVQYLGTTEFANVSSGLYLNVGGFATWPGATLNQFATGYVSEEWNLYPATTGRSTYPLTVNSGTGAGTYAAGSTVTITANQAPSGYQFSGWTASAGALASASASTTTLTMPALAAAVTANYTAVPQSYALTVTNGSGSGNYTAGTAVAITANGPATGYQFSGWTGASSVVASSTSSTTTLTMPAAAVTVNANYTAVPATYPLTVASGSGAGTYTAGTVVAVTANAPATGYKFAGWTGTTSALANTTSPTTTLTMPASAAVLSANYVAVPATYALTVTNGSGSGTYGQGTVLTVSANAAPTGYRFSNWSGTTGALASTTSATTTLTMPASAAVLSANYTAIPTTYVLAVTNGSGSGTYGQGTVVTISANAAPPGYQFSGWSGTTSTLASANSTTTMLTMPATTVALTATYTAIAAATYPVMVTNGTGSGTYSTGTVVTVAANTPPSGYRFIKWMGNTSTMSSTTAPTATLIVPANTTSVAAMYSPATYALTVTNGSGGGNYSAGTAVVVSATAPPAGYQFAGWTGSISTLANASAASTTLTIPAGATAITATYAQSLTASSSTNLGRFSLLNEGSAQGNSMIVLYGQSVEGGSLITYWQPGSPNMSVVAMGNNLYEIIETGGGRCLTAAATTVTVANCTGGAPQLFALTQQTDGSYLIQSGMANCIGAAGAFSPISVSPCNSSLDQRWKFIGNQSPTANGSPVPSTYLLTVNNGTGSGTYLSGTIVTIAAGVSSNGYQFSNWTGATGGVSNLSAATTTLTMPASATTVSAAYAQSSGAGPGNPESFSLLNEGAPQGNSMTLLYGQSAEGAQLITYWQSSTPSITVIPMANSQYEIVENTGNRCLTSAGTTVTVTTCAGSASQLFSLNPQSDGSYAIQSASGNCVEAAAAFSSVAALPCSSSPTQRWNFVGPQPLAQVASPTTIVAHAHMSSSAIARDYAFAFVIPTLIRSKTSESLLS